MKQFLSAGAVLMTACTLVGGNPGGFPEYERTLTVEYATPGQAKKAQLVKRNLPPGKKIAFSLRWDDANPRHVRQYQAFHPFGFKANFYVCTEPKDFFRPLIAGGCSVGSHTVNHPYMIFSEPNEIFRQVMSMRIAIESAYNHCVNAFVMPSGLTYGLSSTKAGPKVHHVMGTVLLRSGHLGSPEPANLDLPVHFGIPRDQWFNSLTFSPGDTNPDPVRFRKMLNERLKLIKTKEPYFGPYITMGIHSWQKEEGFKLMEKEIYGKYGNNPEWWYCTATEYFAFRYQFLHTRVEKIGVSGNKAVFRITGSSAPELGSNVFMTLESNVPLKSASAGKAPVAVEGSCISIGHDPDHVLPESIETVRNHQTARAGLKVDMEYSKEKHLFSITLTNQGKNALRDLSLILRLPPLFRQKGVLRDQVKKLSPGETKTFTLAAEPESEDPFLISGTMRAYFQADFREGNKGKRVHSVFISPRQVLTSACPRDCVKIIGPLPGDTVLIPGFAEDASTPGKALKNYEDTPMGKWHTMNHPGHGILGVHPYAKGIRRYKKDDIISLYLLEFESPAAGKVNLFRWRSNARIFLNGKEVANNQKLSLIPAQAKKGWNRVLFIIRGPQWNMDAAVSVSAGEDPLDHLPCRMPR